MSSFPTVSIVIPMRNEEKYIGPCLDSILAGDYPHDRIEIILVDDRSTDRSREIVAGYRESRPSIRLLESVRRSVPAALNIGFNEAKGEIIVRMDAHAVYASDYVRLCVSYLKENRAECVGGLQRGKGENTLTHAIAAAMASRFGAGGAAYRQSCAHEYVDTVYLGAWRRETLDRLRNRDGLVYNENLAANEDYELNYRLRNLGGRILLAPDIISTYFVRADLKKLAVQYFRYGFNKILMLAMHPRSLRLRQIAAPALVLAIMGSLPATAAGCSAGWVIPGVYTLALAAVSALNGLGRNLMITLLLPAVFVTMHMSWGIGFLAGLPRAALKSLKGGPGPLA